MIALPNVVAWLLAGTILAGVVVGATVQFDHNEAAVPPAGDMAVRTDRFEYNAGDTVRIALRNEGEQSLTGAPHAWILNADGAMVRSFDFGEFEIELEPGEAVWVKWSTSAYPDPCQWAVGRSEASLDVAPRPCPMVADAAGLREGGLAPVPHPMPTMTGTYVIVGVFAERADATTVRIR